MNCPNCKSSNTKVKPERYIKEGDGYDQRVIRFEQCKDCKWKYPVEMKVMPEKLEETPTEAGA